MITKRHQSILGELKSNLSGKGSQEQHSLAPSSVDLLPRDGNSGQPTQAQVVDSSKVSRVPDVEGCVKDVGLLEALQLTLCVLHLVLEAVAEGKYWLH